MKAKILDALFLFASLLLICAVIAFKEPHKMAPFQEIFAQVSPVQYGVPEEIQGTWYGTTQTLTFDDSYLRKQQAGNHDREYQASLTLVQEKFDLANVRDTANRTLYMLNWNQTAYEQHYNEKASPFVKEALYVVYDRQSDSLILSNGQVLRRQPLSLDHQAR